MPDLLNIDAAYNSIGQRSYTSIVFKVGSTYYARKNDGSLISSSTTLDGVLSAACALKGSVLIAGTDTSTPTNMSFSGSFAGIDLQADTCVIIDKSVNLNVSNGYTGFVFRDHDQGYLGIVLYGSINENGSPARNWTFFKLQSDGSSGCINTYLQGFGGQINNASVAVELNCTSPGFINGNTFSGLFIDGTVTAFKFVGSSTGPIHHNYFENITLEGENGGAVRTGFKDICGERNAFIKCDTNDFASTDFSFNFTSSSRGNHVENCALDQGTFVDQGFQNSVTNVRTGGDTTSGILTSQMTRPDLVKIGTWFANGNITGGEGILNGKLSSIAVGTGTSSGSNDNTGVYQSFDTGATINSLTGNRLNFALTKRLLHPYFKTSINLGSNTNVRVFAGFVATSSAPVSAADPLNALEGVALWFDSGVSANWKRMHNDNVGASTVDDTGLAAGTGTLYPVEIYAVDDNRFRFVFNGTTTDITTNIPASTTSLAYWLYMENTTGASRTFKSAYVVFRSDA